MLRALSRKVLSFLRRSKSSGVGSDNRQGPRAPVEESVTIESDRLLGSMMFAASTQDKTLVIFMGAEPLSYSLGLMMSHTPAICGVIRNIAYWLTQVYGKDADLLVKVAQHGDIQPEKTPFAPISDPPYTPLTAFTGELSYYEVAQMCMVAMDSYREIAGGPFVDEKFTEANKFWTKVWEALPDTVKMSALQTSDNGGNVVN